MTLETNWMVHFLADGSAHSANYDTDCLVASDYFALLSVLFKSCTGVTVHEIESALRNTTDQQLLQAGIASLLAFTQAGWTGPELEWNSMQLFPENVSKKLSLSAWNKRWLLELVADGEEPYSLTPDPFLIWLAEFIFTNPKLLESRESVQPSTNLSAWWASRSSFTHQKLLENQSATLYERSFKFLDIAKSLVHATTSSRTLQARIHLEEGLLHHWYGNDVQAKACFQQAQLASGLKWDVTGILGKRTKFQQFETSQLAIMASSSLTVESKESKKSEPKILELNDETLLEKIEYTQNGDDESQNDRLTGNLNPIDQSILLAFCLNVKNTNPVDGLTTEEMFPYVSRVLENPNNWMITTMGLVLKSRLESSKSRTVERSCLQLQALVDQWKLQENDASVPDRMKYIHALLLPSKWEMEKELGLRFVSLGVVRSALEIFQRLDMWDNVISCYQMLEQPKKAEEVILEQLLKFPDSPKLLCLLGDVRGDFTMYEKAWEISEGRFARAMRSLGAHHFETKQWGECIACYEKALAINPLFENSWFVMGCAALQIEDYGTSIKAFSRCTVIDPQNFEAWNNQASAFIKQKRLVEAFRCLKEAVRINYEASNVWENFLFVAVDLKEISEAIRATERIFSIRMEKQELKSSAIDEQVFEIIATSIVHNILDINNQPCSIHAKKFENVLQLLLSKTATAKLYAIASGFYRWKKDYSQMLEYAGKTYRLLLHDTTLNENHLVFEGLVEATLEVVKAYVECATLKQIPRMGVEETVVCPDGIYQARMALKAVMGRTKAIYGDSSDYQRLADAFQEVKGLKS